MVKNEALKKALADAIGYTGSIEDQLRFTAAIANFEMKRPGEFLRICEELVKGLGKNDT